MLVNPAHMKAVPGRKTDVKDAQWIADLLRHGLLTASRVPERPQRERQEAMRYRQRLIEDRVDEVRRLQKVLEGIATGWRGWHRASCEPRVPL
jgi:transposase